MPAGSIVETVRAVDRAAHAEPGADVAGRRRERTVTEYLIGFNDEWVPEHTPEQLTAKSESVWLVIEDMLAQGVLVYSHGGLDSSSVVGSVEAQHGEPVFSDGPYAETKEHLGGFAIVDVRDLAYAPGRAWLYIARRPRLVPA